MAYPASDESAPDTAESAAPEGGEGDPENQPEEGETALLPKSILAGKEFNPGDEVVLKIVRINEDEVEVSYAKSDKGGKTGGRSQMDQATDGLASMAEPA